MSVNNWRKSFQLLHNWVNSMCWLRQFFIVNRRIFQYFALFSTSNNIYFPIIKNNWDWQRENIFSEMLKLIGWVFNFAWLKFQDTSTVSFIFFLTFAWLTGDCLTDRKSENSEYGCERWLSHEDQFKTKFQQKGNVVYWKSQKYTKYDVF